MSYEPSYTPSQNFAPTYAPSSEDANMMDLDIDLFDEKNDEQFARTTAVSSIAAPSPNNMYQDNKAKKMMENMGYEEGKGLGKGQQGITQQIRPRFAHDRRGIGAGGQDNEDEENTDTGFNEEEFQKKLPSGFVIQKHEPIDSAEQYEFKQEVNFVSCPQQQVDSDTLYQLTNLSNAQSQLSLYCSTDSVNKLNKAKSQFDGIDDVIFRDARFRSNPYEKVGRSIFQNRAAVKMANLDKLAALSSVTRLYEEKNVLYFADICAGPGGFTEFLYWKYKTEGAKGFGFTLKGKDDFRLDKFNKDSPSSNFECLYGTDSTGDITKNENLRHFASHIEKNTPAGGVALVMGDGGFSVAGDENNQEILTRQLVMCQFLCALMILRKGGHFVCKLFDTFTQFSASLLFILYQNFEQFSIVKPFTSRPANSERYVICKGLKEKRPPAVDFLLRVNQEMNEQKNPAQSILSLVPDKYIEDDKQFVEYLTSANNEVAQTQVKFLDLIKLCAEDKHLDMRQTQFELRKKCLEEWDLPLPSAPKKNPTPFNYNDKKGGGNYNNSQHQPRFPRSYGHGAAPYQSPMPYGTPTPASPFVPQTPYQQAAPYQTPSYQGSYYTPKTPQASLTSYDKQQKSIYSEPISKGDDKPSTGIGSYAAAKITPSDDFKKLPKIPKLSKTSDASTTAKKHDVSDLEKMYRGE